MKKTWSFEVSGTGIFPFDMLRHDSCWPGSYTSVEGLLEKTGRVIVMYSDREPTKSRWASFGWAAKKIGQV